MLNPISDLPAGVVGLRAQGTVIAEDVSQALVVAKGAPGAGDGLILFIDPDLDGYLSEIFAALDNASQSEAPPFQRWALLAPDGVVKEAEHFRSGSEVQIFPQSRRDDALAWVAG
jgi:hypothetical protein